MTTEKTKCATLKGLGGFVSSLFWTFLHDRETFLEIGSFGVLNHAYDEKCVS